MLLIAGLLGGGYVLVPFLLKQNAIEAIEELNQTSQSIFAGSQIDYDDIRVNIFKRSAILENPVYHIAGKQILIADEIEIAGGSDKLEYADISNMEMTFSYNDLLFSLTASHLQIEELSFDLEETLLSMNDDAFNTILSISQALDIGKFEIEDFLLNAQENSQDDVITASGNLLVSEVKNAIVEHINIDGSIVDNSRILAGDRYQFEAGQVELSDLDLDSVITAIVSNETEIMPNINHAFGISKMNVEDVLFLLPEVEIKTVIEEGKLEIDENIVQALLIEGFEFEVKPEETNITIAEFHVEGLDLGIDFSSQEAVYQNASQLFGINDLGFTDVAILSEGFPIYIAELRMSDIVTDSGVIISGNSMLSELEIPISAVKNFNKATAEKIRKDVKSDNLKVSFRNEFNYEIDEKHYSNFIALELDGLAELDINLEFGSLNLGFMKEGVGNPSIALLADSAKEIMLEQVHFEYRDFELVDILFETYPKIAQGIDLLEIQASLLLLQYPEQQQALITALNDFQREKNKFGFSVDAINELKISSIPGLFVSGRLAEHALIDFYGK